MPTFTWGASSADWFAVPSGWVGGAPPGIADTALLPTPGAYGVVLSAGETASVAAVLVPQVVNYFGDPATPDTDPVTLDIAAGATLAVAQGVTLGDGTLSLAGILAGNLLAPPAPSLPPGTIGPSPLGWTAGTLDGQGGTITGTIGLSGTLAISGTIALSGSAPNVVIGAGGTLRLAAGSTLSGAVYASQGRIEATDFTVPAGNLIGGTISAASLTNHGTLATTRIDTTGGLHNAADGRIDIAAGARASIFGSLDNAGSIAIAAGATLSLDQQFDFAVPLGLGALSGPGTLALRGGASGGTIDLAAISAGLGGVQLSGTLAGSLLIAAPAAGIGGESVLDGVTVAGTLTLLPDRSNGFATPLPTIRNGLTLLGGVLPIATPGGTLTAGGTLAGGIFSLGAPGTATLLRTATTLAIAADALLATSGPQALGLVAGAVANLGSIDAAGAGARLSFETIANEGAITVETGATLALANLTGTGSLQIAQGGTLQLTSPAASTLVRFMDASTNVLAGVGAFSVAGFAGNNAIELNGLAGLGLSYSGDANGGRLTFTAPGGASVTGINFVGDYRAAPFIMEQRGTEAFAMLGGPGIPVLLAGANAYYAAQGNDTVVAGTGADTVSAGLRHVMAWGGGGSLTFLGDRGINTVVGGAGATSAYGGAGQLTVYGGSGALLAQGGTLGGNLLVGGSGATTLIGGGAGDALFATGGGGNLLMSGPGAETLSTQLATGANTILASGAGKLIAAGAGADLIVAGALTTVFGGSGATTIHGGSLVAAGSGANVIDGAATVFGGTGSSTIYTAGFSGGTNVYVGGGGDQVIVDAGGPNLIYGGAGTQAILGGAAATTVIGGAGGSVFQAGAGPALFLPAGAGDLLVMPTGAGAAVLVGGFRPGVDFVQLQGYGAGEAARAVAAQSHAGGASTLLLSDGAVITFAGLDAVTLGAFV